ncbi:amino acid permease [Nitzschia inconspicua]|uniref:Amino acid permease n=1 Tax=Nitzschia inconspicua TaxID=303405 RepID=A0A9K3M385_9STRA|nr:amino acid permease [Nitzschia inconspicua]
MFRHYRFDRSTLEAMFQKKSLADAKDSPEEAVDGTPATTTSLKRSLTALDLVLYGVGSSVGAGIFVLVGLGAKITGPGIAISFMGCGLACVLTSLAYSEFASLIPASGSAFTYTYVAFGEFFAFLVGWNLILGYGFTASVAARAWADYTGDFLIKLTGQNWIMWMTEFPLVGKEVDYTCSPLSVVIIAISTAVLLRGAKDSSMFNNFMTIMNLSILLLVVLSAVFSGSLSDDNFAPFVPKGLPGILRGAGLVFYAFIGFDMVASLSEEVIHPEKNMPIGIVGSLVVSTLIYVTVSLCVVGMAPFRYLGETIPIVNALMTNACCSHDEQMEQMGIDQTEACLRDCQMPYEKPTMAVIGHIVSGGAIFGLVGACFTSLMGQPRIFYRMAKDGLWFPMFAKIDPETQVMAKGIWVTGIVAGFMACFVPLEALANLISLGTLMVFTFVDTGVVLLRLENVAQASLETVHRLVDKEKERCEFRHNHRRVTVMLMLFIVSLLAASLFLSHSNMEWPIFTFLAIASVCGITIIYTPASWTTKQQNTASHHHSLFECPCFPVVPLAGAGFNTFMMGSLPMSSWLLCLVWMILGMSVYFLYGIHHSQLRNEDLQEADTFPLMTYTSPTTDAKKADYGGTLVIT